MLTDEQLSKLDKLPQEFARQFKQTLPEVEYHVKHTPTLEITIPAKHPEVGNILITFEGEEVTVYAGEYHHCHFSPFF